MPNETAIFVHIIFSFFGIYIWDLIQTFNFEISLFTRKRRFTWPLIFFFLCRYSMLLALIGLIISSSLVHPINCQALYTFNSFAGQMTILNASISLMIKTIALWQQKYVTIPLVLLSAARWAVLFRGMFILEVVWDDTTASCSIVKINKQFLEATYFFTMAFDAIILILTTTILLRFLYTRSGLWNLLFRDGLVYFLIPFSCNSVPAILNVLNLNAVVNIIATVPAITITAIAACRLVMRLQGFHITDHYIHTSKMAHETCFTPARNVVKPPSSRCPDFGPSIPGPTAGKSVYDIKSEGDESYGKFDKDSDSFTRAA